MFKDNKCLKLFFRVIINESYRIVSEAKTFLILIPAVVFAMMGMVI